MSTSSDQLNRHFRRHPLWGGCLCKDEVKNLKPDGKFWILNMEDSDQGHGSYWVLASDVAPLPPLYIDPYGVAPPKVIADFLGRSQRGLRPVYSRLQYQELTSQNCGRFCVDFIEELLKHPSLRAFDRHLTPYPSERNEREVGRIRLPVPKAA